jgi:hypothetical protein
MKTCKGFIYKARQNWSLTACYAVVLSWLLHHANRLGRNEHFYKIKNQILSKYGTHICYDVQFIEGKKCYSCKGTGLYPKYDHYTGWYHELCYNCYNGWYKRPTWNILAKVKFGNYEFHQPYKRVYEKPDNSIHIIEGFIDHNKSKYSKFALNILFFVYEKGFIKRWYKETGNGWRCKWHLPKNWIPNIIHFIKHGFKAYPIRHTIEAIKMMKQRTKFSKFETSDELPF